MVKIGILGDIGSGKSFVANSFGYPVFNADKIVAELYQNDKLIFSKLKKILPKHFSKFPVSKKKVLDAIFDDERNLKKIVKIVHKEVRKKLYIFLKQNSSKKIVILDNNLLLLKTEMDAGHGGKSGRDGAIEEIALDYAFALKISKKI